MDADLAFVEKEAIVATIAIIQEWCYDQLVKANSEKASPIGG